MGNIPITIHSILVIYQNEQLMRLYRNCSNPTDYEDQTIINRSVEKGYNKKELVALKEKVKKKNGQKCDDRVH